jgi:polysaccharide biosynthesis transport protein
MNILTFIKIIRANLPALILVPLALAALVILFTKDSPKKYVTKTKIYTGIASGYTIESQQNTSFNYFAINNAFDNLINLITSRSTIEETGLRLYALHLIQDEPKMPIMTMASKDEIKRITPKEIYELVDKGSYEKTYQNLLDYMNKDEMNQVYRLINFNNNHYSFNSISQIKAHRLSNSDMVEITFESDDPAVCYQTVNILVNVFTNHYSSLKVNQTDAVVKYFEGQLHISQDKLQKSEDKLLLFNMDNKIINYYEQTKHVASTNEQYELARQAVMLDLAGAESVIKNLEDDMGTRMKIKLQGSNIIRLREEFNKLNEQITLRQFESEESDSTDSGETALLIAKSNRVKEQMYEAVDSLHYFENTKEGIEVQEILNNWLKNVIAFEESKAKLQALEIRKVELDETIKHFAPLGANLKKIEREIDVVEREYLSLLYSLGMAKLKQQDIELSSNIKVVDPPILPLGPLPSNRKIMVIAAALAGFLLTLAFIILIRFFDITLQNTQRAEKITGLKGFGNYPLLNKSDKQKYNEEQLKDASGNAIVNYILKNWSEDGHKPFRIALLSNYAGEGKSELINEIYPKLENAGKSCKIYSDSVENYNDLLTGLSSDPIQNKLDFALTEIHSLIGKILPEKLMKGFDTYCLVIRADRAWTTADQNMLDIIRKIVGNVPLGFILNAVKPDDLADFIGQIPKKRSKLRKFVKRIVLLRFYEKFEIKQYFS